MSKGAAESAIVLRRLLRSDDGRLKLQAAKVLLEQGMKVREVVDLTRQMEELQQTIEELRRERKTGNNVWDRLASVDATANRGDAHEEGDLPAAESVDRNNEVKPLDDADGSLDSDIKPLFDG